MAQPEVIGALIGIAGLTVLNLAAIAFSYGRMTQQVSNLCDRVKRLEDIVFLQGGQHGTGV